MGRELLRAPGVCASPAQSSLGRNYSWALGDTMLTGTMQRSEEAEDSSVPAEHSRVVL